MRSCVLLILASLAAAFAPGSPAQDAQQRALDAERRELAAERRAIEAERRAVEAESRASAGSSAAPRAASDACLAANESFRRACAWVSVDPLWQTPQCADAEKLVRRYCG